MNNFHFNQSEQRFSALYAPNETVVGVHANNWGGALVTHKAPINAPGSNLISIHTCQTLACVKGGSTAQAEAGISEGAHFSITPALAENEGEGAKLCLETTTAAEPIFLGELSSCPIEAQKAQQWVDAVNAFLSSP